MPRAIPTVQIDAPEVRITQWRLPPGSATGHHRHQYDYVVVPMTDGELTIIAAEGTSRARPPRRAWPLPRGRANRPCPGPVAPVGLVDPAGPAGRARRAGAAPPAAS